MALSHASRMLQNRRSGASNLPPCSLHAQVSKLSLYETSNNPKTKYCLRNKAPHSGQRQPRMTGASVEVLRSPIPGPLVAGKRTAAGVQGRREPSRT